MSSRRAVPREADMSDEKGKRPERKGCGEGEWRVKKSGAPGGLAANLSAVESRDAGVQGEPN